MNNEGKVLVNIFKAVVENERTGEKFEFDTASEAEIKPDLSKGKEDILRIKNRVQAINRTEDIVIGYEIKLKDNTFNPNVLALVEGGTFDGTKYIAPVIGQTVDNTPYTLTLYTEEKDYDETIGYAKFTFKHNKGKAVTYKVQDGKFYVPEFISKSRPHRGEPPVDIEFIKSLDGNKPSKPEIEGGIKKDSNTDLDVEITNNRVTWTFKEAVNQDDVTKENFLVRNKITNSVVEGIITVSGDKKIVTFVPDGLEAGTRYMAEAKAIRKLDGTGKTSPISVEFATLNL